MSETTTNHRLRVRVTRPVSSDLPELIPAVHIGPGEYDAGINRYGAVWAELRDGTSLGLRPHEFEFVAENVAEMVHALTAALARAEAAERNVAEVAAAFQHERTTREAAERERETLRARIEALPRWGMVSRGGEPAEMDHTPRGRWVSLSDLLRLLRDRGLTPPPSGTTETGR